MICRRYASRERQSLCISLAAFLLLTTAAMRLDAMPLWTEKPTPAASPVALYQLNAALQELATALLPAVVSLQVHTVQEATAPPNGHLPQAENLPTLATGSGFIIRADGLALTSYHVVEDSVHIEVHLYNGETTTATVLGQDPVGDLALLQIASDHPLPVVPLGNSSGLAVGEFVVAIGSPFGFEHTLTFGVVSATKRRFMRSGLVGGYIQTDASINTGNSGGPLVNIRGEVVGLNTATVGRGELGFAIPSNAIKAVLPQLYTGGQIRRGWLGVQIRPLNTPKARELGVLAQQGVYVHDVITQQPAERAGILAGDVITQFDGLEIKSPLDLQSAVAGTPVGKTVQVHVLRKRTVHQVQLTVGEMPEP
jgi:serine protease Do